MVRKNVIIKVIIKVYLTLDWEIMQSFSEEIPAEITLVKIRRNDIQSFFKKNKKDFRKRKSMTIKICLK